MKPQAFTLVEMLIVVAIIGLMAALLFPVFGRVREAGRRTTCASNLKQIGLALNQYTQDYKFYPKLNNAVPPESGIPCDAWPDKMLPYIKSEQVFECPSDFDHRYKSSCPPEDLIDPLHPISFNGSYTFNLPYAGYISTPGQGATEVLAPGIGTSPLRYTRPSSTILVVDGNNMVGGIFVSPGYQQPPPTDAASLPNYGVPDRHQGGVNSLFADGHVKWMSLESLLKLSLWRINGPE